MPALREGRSWFILKKITAAVWCVPALRVPLVLSLINHFRQNTHSTQNDDQVEMPGVHSDFISLSTFGGGMLLEVQGGVSRYEERFAASA